MGQWTTVLRQPGGDVFAEADECVKIKRGIFQGDSLSPLWFCLALNPLSTLLRDSGLGYRLRRGGEVVSHLLYMDDLKLFASKRQDLTKLLEITQDFSNSIRMEFGVDKCAVLHVQRGRVMNSESIQLPENICLRSLSEVETYKYLGMSESLGISDADMKQSVRQRFFSRLAKVLNSLLSGGNKVRAYNSWVMPVLIYSFGILKWTQTELDALDRRVRLLLTTNRMHHPRSSVMRLYISRSCGGRGFLNGKNLHNREICNLRDYFLNANAGMHRDVVAADKGFTPLSLAKENWRTLTVVATDDRRAIWKSKALHGRFYQALNGPDIKGMQATKRPVIWLLLLLAIDCLQANKRIQKEKVTPSIINICDISDRDSKVHCYCEQSQEINKAIRTECWVFNGGIEKNDPIWNSFASQSNIETLAFNVRADGGLDFVPTQVLRYLHKVKNINVKYSSISEIEAYTFINLTSLEEIMMTKNQIEYLSKHSFYNLPNLTVLTLDENNIKEVVTDTFFELPSLQKLYLTNNNLSVIQGGAFRRLVNLLELELDKNNISELKKECFDGLANLKRLDLRRNKLSVLNSFIFTELWNLQVLLLDNNEISIMAPRSFDGLSQLKKLSLSYNKLVTLTTGLFEGIRALSGLNLRHNQLKRCTFDDLKPIYDNLMHPISYIYLEGNEFPCDCHLAWMHNLRHETKSTKIKTSLENFVCKFSADLATNSQFTYFEKNVIGSNNLYDVNQRNIENLDDNTDDNFHDEVYDVYAEETKIVQKDNERTLLQIPIELLPCPQDVKVTDKTYTYPSQNEAKDYRNLIQSSTTCILFIDHLPINPGMPVARHKEKLLELS
ncbi:uncharacterized protein ACR2FA_006251 [Aphomia sociella]